MLENNQKKIIIKDYSLPTIVERNCLICDIAFTIKRKEIWRGGGKYCSKECSYIGKGIMQSLNFQKNRFEKQCKVCNSFIYVKQSHKDIEGTYCSKECMIKDYKIILRGSDNPNYTHGLSNTKEYRISHSHKRRVIRSDINNSLTSTEISNKLKNIQVCYWCNKNMLKTKDKCYDHYIPLAKGGTNTIDNIVVSCRSCNAKKHAKDPFIFANERGRLL